MINGVVTKKTSFLFAFVFLFFVAVIAGIRGPDVDHDYAQYIEYINIIKNGGISSIGETSGGYIFDFISYIGINIEWIGFVFLFYAISSVLLKMQLFFVRGNARAASYIIIYCGLFLFLHEFTQIRVGLAIAFSYWSIYYRYVRSNTKSYISFIAGVMLHPSVLVVGIIYMFSRRHFDNIKWLMLLISSAIAAYSGLLSTLIFYLFKVLNIPILNLYVAMLADDENSVINVFGVFPLLNLVIAILCCIYLAEDKLDEFDIIVVKLYLMSSISWFLLATIPVLSGRISQIYLFAGVFCIPLLARTISKKYEIIFTIAYSLLSFIAFLYVGNLLNDYQL